MRPLNQLNTLKSLSALAATLLCLASGSGSAFASATRAAANAAFDAADGSAIQDAGEFLETVRENESNDQEPKRGQPIRDSEDYPAGAPLEDVDSVLIKIRKVSSNPKAEVGRDGRLYLKVNERLVATWRITSGGMWYDPDLGDTRLYPTATIDPPGVKPGLMDPDYVSKSYPRNKDGTRGGAKMPYSIFFTNTGQAIHTGSTSTVSHGCIHLRDDRARKLFNYVALFKSKTRIVIVDTD